MVVAKQGLLLILFLGLFGVATGFVVGGIWLVLWAPQLLLLGGVVMLGCWMLVALVSSHRRKRR